jgi:hypothetical protein
MKKNHLRNWIFLSLVTGGLATVCPANAGTYEDLTYSLSNEEITITDCATSAAGELVIPNTIESYPVTYIGSSAFRGCTELTTVAIPDSVITIDDSAFRSCTGLTNMTIPDSVISVGNSAFYNCSELKNVTVGNSVTSIGNSAFYNCSGLTDVTISDSVTFIDDSAFFSCSSLTSVTIPDSVTSLGEYVFARCSDLTSATLPDNLTSIPEGSFVECSTLKSVTIPDSVTSIGEYAFGYCYSLPSATIPDNVTSIDSYAFFKCYNLADVTIPDGVTSIRKYAFAYCYDLTNVTIPNKVTSIERGAFKNSSKLSSVTIPDSVTSVNTLAFYSCSSLTTVTIPDSVTTIGSSAFKDCSSLTNTLFLGDAPNAFGTTVFDNTISNFTVQFYEGASGFSTPEWEGYPCEMLIAPPVEFNTWVASCPEGAQGAGDTPDGDGIPNLIKYAAGLEPGTTCTSSDLFSCSTETTSSNRVVRLTYYRDPTAIEANLYPVFSSSLTDTDSAWTTNGITKVDTGTIDSSGRDIWQASIECEDDCGFLRLSAELQ